jgi:hypothetical protein
VVQQRKVVRAGASQALASLPFMAGTRTFTASATPFAAFQKPSTLDFFASPSRQIVNCCSCRTIRHLLQCDTWPYCTACTSLCPATSLGTLLSRQTDRQPTSPADPPPTGLAATLRPRSEASLLVAFHTPAIPSFAPACTRTHTHPHPHSPTHTPSPLPIQPAHHRSCLCFCH